MKTLFILNPQAGKNRRRPGLRLALEQFIRQHRLDAVVAPTSGPGHATELAQAAVAARCTHVVAVGGDGTMNEVAQGLLGSSALLVLAPCGSGNGLARHLGLPGSLDLALGLLIDPHGVPFELDVGEANGHPFFNAMGLGFDAEISQRFNRLTRRGLAAYVRTVVGALGSFRSERVRIHLPDSTLTADAALVAIGNSDQYGNDARIAPGARVNDGRLNLTLVPPLSLLGCIGAGLRLFHGSIDRHPGVLTRESSHFTLVREKPGLIHTDGETHATTATVHVRLHPAKLRLLVPESTLRRQAESSTPARASRLIATDAA